MTPETTSRLRRPKRSQATILIWTGIFIHSLGLAAGLLLAGWWITNRDQPRPSDVPSPVRNSPALGKGMWESVGPWGTLSCQPIFTEKPSHFIDLQSFLVVRENWLLPGLSPTRAREWMEQNGIRPEIASALLQAEPSEQSSGTSISPGHELIASLNPEERAKLHKLMAQDPSNTYSVDPFRFSQSVLERIRGDPEFSQAVFSLDRLLYKTGMAYCLSDISTFLEPFKEEETQKKLLKRLTATESLLVKVVVTPGMDTSSVAQYWGGSTNLKDREVLLSSLCETGNPERLDIIHLLPPVPRKLLYTYPPAMGQSIQRDCHWTCMNFFEESANDDYLDLNIIARELKDNYMDIEEVSKPGDLVLLTEDGNSVLHSCVYLAGDIVYTKNGKGGHQPWTIMKLSQVMGFYKTERDLKLLFKRRK